MKHTGCKQENKLSLKVEFRINGVDKFSREITCQFYWNEMNWGTSDIIYTWTERMIVNEI